MSKENRSGTVVAGLALFSMFFGAGDLIWPLILGGNVGDQNFYALMGLLITGVSLPLLGLLAMMLFEGDHRAFFGRMGVLPAVVVLFAVQVILGPAGSIPRLLTLSYSTLKPYLFEEVTLSLFTILASALIFAFTVRPQRVIDVLGGILTPLLLLTLLAVVVAGIINHPSPPVSYLGSGEAFSSGLLVGYNTLDLIASFMYAPLVLAHFTGKDAGQGKKEVFNKMVKACLIAAGLLSATYIGLSYVSSFHTQSLDLSHQPEERLAAISLHLLGPAGALVAGAAVLVACLTTAIPLVSIFSSYLREDLLGGRGGHVFPLIATLLISAAIANLGYMGIAGMLGPVLQILCPGLIVLSILNIFHKLYETRVPKIPVLATFALSTAGYMF